MVQLHFLTTLLSFVIFVIRFAMMCFRVDLKKQKQIVFLITLRRCEKVATPNLATFYFFSHHRNFYNLI
jgi:hypothetical protein